MQLYHLTDEDVLKARGRARDLGALRKSFTKGAGNEIGMQGEYAVAKHIGAVAEKDTYDYDLVTPKGVRVEVKSKHTTVKGEPNLDYMASVSTANTEQDCDVYFFTRVVTTRAKTPKDMVWVLGFMPRQEFYDRAVFYKKGMKDPSNGYEVWHDCWNVPIGDLYQWNENSEDEILKTLG